MPMTASAQTSVKAVLVSFDVQSYKMNSQHERNTFYNKLYGKDLVQKKGEKIYTYNHKGVLSTIPNIKIDKSVFIIPREYKKALELFFEYWKEKITYRMVNIVIEDTTVVDELKKYEELFK